MGFLLYWPVPDHYSLVPAPSYMLYAGGRYIYGPSGSDDGLQDMEIYNSQDVILMLRCRWIQEELFGGFLLCLFNGILIWWFVYLSFRLIFIPSSVFLCMNGEEYRDSMNGEERTFS